MQKFPVSQHVIRIFPFSEYNGTLSVPAPLCHLPIGILEISNQECASRQSSPSGGDGGGTACCELLINLAKVRAELSQLFSTVCYGFPQLWIHTAFIKGWKRVGDSALSCADVSSSTLCLTAVSNWSCRSQGYGVGLYTLPSPLFDPCISLTLTLCPALLVWIRFLGTSDFGACT